MENLESQELLEFQGILEDLERWVRRVLLVPQDLKVDLVCLDHQAFLAFPEKEDYLDFLVCLD